MASNNRASKTTAKRQDDISEHDNPEKQKSRQRNLDFLIKYGQAIWEDHPGGILKPHVIELIGKSGHLSYETFKGHLANPDLDFIGVEWAREVFYHAWDKLDTSGQPYKFPLERGEISKYLVSNWSKKPASVIIWDSTNSMGNRRWWSSQGRRLQEALKGHSKAFGEVALLLTMSLRGRLDTHQKHVENLKIFRQKLMDIFRVPEGAIIKDHTVVEASNPLGEFESLEFYKAKSTSMVTFRAIYSADGHHRMRGLPSTEIK